MSRSLTTFDRKDSSSVGDGLDYNVSSLITIIVVSQFLLFVGEYSCRRS